MVERRSLARVAVAGQDDQGMAVFELDAFARGWRGVTTFSPERASYFERRRAGRRL